MHSRRFIIFFLALVSFFLVLANFSWRYYLETTIEVVDYGGVYTEGVIGQPTFLNPVFAISDVDRDVTALVFSGLVKINEQGNAEPDLAESYVVSDNGKQYDFYLRKNVAWHDGQLFSSDDVYFTMALLQNPDTKSPLKTNYEGLKIEKISTYHIRFSLPSPYAYFLHSMTIGILPYHLLRDLPPQDLLKHRFNLAPVGTGPFVFEKLVPRKNNSKEYASVILLKNKNYYIKEPYLDQVILKFFSEPATTEKLLQAYHRGEIDGFASFSIPKKNILTHINPHFLRIPEMKAVFFNMQSQSAIKDLSLRKILDLAVDKRELFEKLSIVGYQVQGPLLVPKVSDDPAEQPPLEVFQDMLAKEGWKIGANGIVEKDGKPLTLTFVTSDLDENVAVANFLVETWKRLAIQVDLQVYPQDTFINDYLKPRNYDLVLLKVNLGSDPDQYLLWHSSQLEKDVSFNFSNYKNTKVDVLLEDSRRLVDDAENYENTTGKRQKKYEAFEKILLADVPAIFLYAPYYIYGVDSRVKGIDVESISKPSDRFNDISSWAVTTKRIPRTS